MSTASDLEALRALFVESRARAQSYSSAEVARAFRADLFPAFDAAAFEVAASALGGPFLSTDWANWRYGQTAPRKVTVARTATGVAVVTNGSTIVDLDFAPGELVLVHPTSGARYRNVGALTLPRKGALLTSVAQVGRVRVEAEVPGEGGTSTATSVDLAAPISGVTAALVGNAIGNDVETEEAYRTRLFSHDVLSEAVREVRRADLTFAANRARQADGVVSAAGMRGGISNADRDLLRVQLRRADTVGLISAAPVAIDVAYSLEVPASTAPPSIDLEAAIAAKLAAYVPTLPIGPTTISRAALDTVARVALGLRASTDRVFDAPNLITLVVTDPAIDVQLAAHQVAILGTVTPTITRV